MDVKAGPSGQMQPWVGQGFLGLLVCPGSAQGPLLPPPAPQILPAPSWGVGWNLCSCIILLALLFLKHFVFLERWCLYI